METFTQRLNNQIASFGACHQSWLHPGASLYGTIVDITASSHTAEKMENTVLTICCFHKTIHADGGGVHTKAGPGLAQSIQCDSR